MSDTELNKSLSEIFSGMVSGFEKQRIEENPALFEYLKNINMYDDLSSVELMILWPIKELIKSVLSEKYGEDKRGIAWDIITNWSFYESHLTKLIEGRDGFGCVADKSNSMLRKKIDEIIKGKKPSFSETREHYWEPKFGSIQEWMMFIDSLYSLRFGNPVAYFKAYMALIKGDAGMKPLFIPLNTKYYNAFKSGIKDEELRAYGPRWNHKTCVVGRPVILSKGYGKQNRMLGKIWKFKKQHGSLFGATYKESIKDVFGKLDLDIACISITDLKPLHSFARSME